MSGQSRQSGPPDGALAQKAGRGALAAWRKPWVVKAELLSRHGYAGSSNLPCARSAIATFRLPFCPLRPVSPRQEIREHLLHRRTKPTKFLHPVNGLRSAVPILRLSWHPALQAQSRLVGQYGADG